MNEWMNEQQGKEKALSYDRMAASKCGRKEGIRQSPLGNYHSKNWSRQEIPNSAVWWEAGHLHSLGISHDKILLHLKRDKKSNFTVENPGDTILTKWYKVTPTGKGQRAVTASQCDGDRRTCHCSVALLPRRHKLANDQATADRLKWKDLLQNHRPVPL